MSKHKSHAKDKKKDAQLVIRVDKGERDAFVRLCDQLDTSAAREIRRFMRERVAAHSAKDPVAGGEGKNAVIADTTNDEPVRDNATSPETVTEADIPAAATKTTEKIHRRVTRS